LNKQVTNIGVKRQRQRPVEESTQKLSSLHRGARATCGHACGCNHSPFGLAPSAPSRLQSR